MTDIIEFGSRAYYLVSDDVMVIKERDGFSNHVRLEDLSPVETVLFEALQKIKQIYEQTTA